MRKKAVCFLMTAVLIMALVPSMASAATSPINGNTNFTALTPNIISIDALQEISSTNAEDYPGIVWQQVPSLQTVINSDGSVSVLDTNAQYFGETPSTKIVIYEFATNGQLNRSLSLDKALPLTGGFAKDGIGNYYVFFTKEVAEGDFGEKNMALVKYSPQGEKLNEFWIEANPGGFFGGVMVPFNSGTCRLEISGKMISVYFAKKMFADNDGLNHQGSQGFILDIDTFAPLSNRPSSMLEGGTMAMPVISHSFSQFILSINNGYVFIDHGDIYPRAFNFTKVVHGVPAYVEGASFTFAETSNYNVTHAELGGLVQTSSGYLFAGTYGNKQPASFQRNVFLLKLDGNLQGGTTPIWLTDYTDPKTKTTAPKIVKVADNKHAVMWEVNKQPYLAIVNDNGTVLSTSQIEGARLNAFDVLRYNPVTGCVYWAVSNNDGQIKLYSIKP